MEVKVSSIKGAQEELKNCNTENIKLIIASSYEKNVDSVKNENKLILHFDDVTSVRTKSFNKSIAKQINTFINQIDFNKEKLYVCCDSGVSRSSAIAAAILRKYKQDEYCLDQEDDVIEETKKIRKDKKDKSHGFRTV